jgi:hypothetical protein
MELDYMKDIKEFEAMEDLELLYRYFRASEQELRAERNTIGNVLNRRYQDGGPVLQDKDRPVEGREDDQLQQEATK